MTGCRAGTARWWRAAVLGVCGVLALPKVARAQAGECESADDREIRSLTFEGNRAFTSRDLALRIRERCHVGVGIASVAEIDSSAPSS